MQRARDNERGITAGTPSNERLNRHFEECLRHSKLSRRKVVGISVEESVHGRRGARTIEHTHRGSEDCFNSRPKAGVRVRRAPGGDAVPFKFTLERLTNGNYQYANHEDKISVVQLPTP
jgi:hypothetical protein